MANPPEPDHSSRVTPELREHWRRKFSLMAVLGESPGDVVLALLDELDRADAALAPFHQRNCRTAQQAVDLLDSLDMEIAIAEVSAETWSARAVEAEAALALVVDLEEAMLNSEGERRPANPDEVS